ncbi:DinB family protein [Planosporangium mesophilum]|uniref:Mini-circle protein n=1 Tax=Planosporangium mesophilum TaxID=689768 RepID=A0A8J3TB64_9ACTN|nr:DinB family protein [Planosporangium mesophilum]GII22091.1 hypothetical protein Pme01_16880 [Planosporangium mesophilum]
MQRLDPPFTGDERSLLESWLDYHRTTVQVKCAGLAEADAWRTPLPSSPAMSPAGLVLHLYWVERNWFERILTGVDVPLPWLVERDAEFARSGTESLDGVLKRYAEQCERSRELAAGRGLDDTGYHPKLGVDISLRWIYLHMIEETARHNGHFDAMRELIDGTVGE